jgi:MscS family membrane protein
VGVEFAFPTQTLHMDSFYKDTPRKVGEERTEEELASAVTDFGPGGKKGKPEGIRIYRDGEEVDFGANK